MSVSVGKTVAVAVIGQGPGVKSIGDAEVDVIGGLSKSVVGREVAVTVNGGISTRRLQDT